MQKRVSRNPTEFETVLDAIEVRENGLEPIEVDAGASLETVHFKHLLSGDLIKDANAWPQLWAVMEGAPACGAVQPPAAQNGEETGKIMIFSTPNF